MIPTFTPDTARDLAVRVGAVLFINGVVLAAALAPAAPVPPAPQSQPAPELPAGTNT